MPGELPLDLWDVDPEPPEFVYRVKIETTDPPVNVPWCSEAERIPWERSVPGAALRTAEAPHPLRGFLGAGRAEKVLVSPPALKLVRVTADPIVHEARCAGTVATGARRDPCRRARM